ncbi:hypothetical protein J4457_05820 [Candidatus Woesearchaeota archaeon]|nr:hypothetical protein [Candidatus Woesearchaeota archaeon]
MFFGKYVLEKAFHNPTRIEAPIVQTGPKIQRTRHIYPSECGVPESTKLHYMICNIFPNGTQQTLYKLFSQTQPFTAEQLQNNLSREEWRETFDDLMRFKACKEEWYEAQGKLVK